MARRGESALDVLRVNSLQTGAYVSHFRGRGMEFDESRPYQPGDDPRSIDWRVTARSTHGLYQTVSRRARTTGTGRCSTCAATMHFATRGCFKSVNASRAAALVSWAAHHRGDRLGGLIFGDTSHRELRPRLGRQAALRYMHELVTHKDWPEETGHVNSVTLRRHRGGADPGNGRFASGNATRQSGCYCQ